jgi:uncharacterized low-complexity protein
VKCKENAKCTEGVCGKAKRAEGVCGKAKCDGRTKRGKVAREVHKCREGI